MSETLYDKLKRTSKEKEHELFFAYEKAEKDGKRQQLLNEWDASNLE